MNFYHGDRYIIKFNEADGKYWKYLEKNYKKVIFNGNENFGRATSPVRYDKRLSILGLPKAMDNHNYLSDYFRNNTTNQWGEFYIRGDWIVFLDDEEHFKTAQEFNNWLKANPVICIYELENKELIPIEPIDIMNMTYYPVTNCFTSIDNIFLKAKYYRDFINTIRNMQIDNGTLKAQLQDIEKRLSAVETRPVTIETTESEVIPNA